jgi:hypothetical protein
MIKSHVLLPFADRLQDAATQCTAKITSGVIESIVKQIPDSWLLADTTFSSAEEYRAAYVEYLQRRLAAPQAFVEEALRARALLV